MQNDFIKSFWVFNFPNCNVLHTYNSIKYNEKIKYRIDIYDSKNNIGNPIF